MTTYEKKVKIVATLGPASASPEVIRKLVLNGVNVFRLNFSHGDHRVHGSAVAAVRNASAETGIETGLLADLQGPKIRTGSTPDNGPVYLETGSMVKITSRKVVCTAGIVSIDYGRVAEEIETGQRVMINDGAIQLTVRGKEPNGDLIAKVEAGGIYSSRKGVNFPDVELSIPSLTSKDRRDLAFVMENDFQFVALSFVRKADDVIALRKILHKRRPDLKIIAKIEKPEAARRIEGILECSDGIMVARGDLGVEATPFVVPVLQKELIEKANSAGKIVVVATQMLESMTKQTIPTRAESTDVANAIIDGTDAIMLSGETAVGTYPVEAVNTMSRIAQVVENSRFIHRGMRDLSIAERFPPHAISEAAVWAGRDLGGIPLCIYTISGETALYCAKLRYAAPMYAFSPDLQVVRTLALAWNITAFHLPFAHNIPQLHKEGEEMLLRRHLVRKGDLIGIISGTHAVQGATNSFRIKEVGVT